MSRSTMILGREPRTGMTLVEVLVTLAIIAVLSTVVVLGLGLSRSDADARTEANLLTARLGSAVDEALVTRRPVALSWDERSYGLMTMDAAGRWSVSPDVRHVLPHGLTLQGDAPTIIVVDGDGGGAAVSLSVSDNRGAWTVAFDGFTATTRSGGA